MRKGMRFRMFLPVAQAVLAGLSGAVGLWQRNQILGRPGIFDDQTLWESTARFHVWPWPYKFAAISNLPAFLTGSLVLEPIDTLWPRLLNSTRPELAEAFELALSLLFVAMLWYWVGYRIDQRWGRAGADGVLANTKTPWILLSVFTVVCFTGAFLPLGYVGYVPYGAVVWIGTAATILRTTQRRVPQIRPPLA
jgi:hypothetical protein